SKAKQSDRGIWFGTPDYFRIHDSGDFWSTKYAEQWFEVAERLPKTKFWSPTRVCLRPDGSVNEKWVNALNAAPDNMIVRPSSLYFEDFPPMIYGLSAGSTAATEVVSKAIWDCPVYKRKKKTCVEAHCRLCWTNPEVPVRYPTHGSEAKRMYRESQEWAEDASAIRGVDHEACFGCLGAIIEPGTPTDAVMSELEDYDLE
ncbi:GP88 family protein, partial [Candidatus Magnetobacterium casense]